MTGMILLIALLLRLVYLNQSLWLDEAIQAEALLGHLGPILQYALADFQPPLYHFLLFGWTYLTGFSEITLRIPSLIAGLGTVYFVMKIGEFLGNRKLGIIAGTLAAINPLLIYYSQEGRTYSLTCFLVTASMYYLLLALKKPSRPNAFYYFLFTTLFLWTSYLSWFLALALGVYLIIKKRWDLFLALCLSVTTLALWVPSLFSSLKLGLGDATTIPNWSQVVGGASVKALALTWIKLNLGRISFANKIIYGLVVGSLAILHTFILRKSRSSILLIWLVAPIILALLVSIFIPVYSYTRVLFIVPAYLLLLAIGLTNAKSNLYIFLLVSISLVSNAYFWLTPRFHREDWRALTADLNTLTNITVAVPSLRITAPLNYYHLQAPLIELTPQSPDTQTIHYVRYGEDIFDPEKRGQANLATSGYTIIAQYTYSGIQVDVYEKNPQD